MDQAFVSIASGDRNRGFAPTFCGRADMFDDIQMKVVINHEEQYSIWPADRDNPLGWRDAGKIGSKEECLAYVEQVWTDMRPLSLRQYMAQLTDQQAPSDKER